MLEQLLEVAKSFGGYASIAGVLMWYIYKQNVWFRVQWERLAKRLNDTEEDRLKLATDFGAKQTEMTDQVVQAIRENSMVQRELIKAINQNTLVMKNRPCLHDKANESHVNLKVIDQPSRQSDSGYTKRASQVG
jgi:hypothetical protein